MSFVRLLAEGAGAAVKLLPLLFTLAAAPAAAQLPRAAFAQEAPADPALALQPVQGSAAPTLVAQHFSLALADDGSSLRTTSTFRNETSAPIAARYVLPLAGAITLRGVDDDTDIPLDEVGCGGEESADGAQFLEAGEPDPHAVQSGVVWLEPGDEVTLVSVRPADVFERDSRRRLVIVLPPPPAGQPVPQFSAEVAVDATRPIVALGSATHGGEVDGLGGSHARLFVPNGRVYASRFLSIDLQLGAPALEAPRHWGNEARLPLAAR